MLIFIYRLSVHKPNRGSRKKVRLKTRQGQRGKKKENWGAKRRKEAITQRRTNRCKGPGLGDTCPNTGKKKIMAIRRKEEQREGVLINVFRSRTLWVSCTGSTSDQWCQAGLKSGGSWIWVKKLIFSKEISEKKFD